MEGIAPLVAAGMSLHWLHARSKRPVGERWQDAPFRTFEALLAEYQPNYNVGVRLGEPSAVTAGYLHAIDIDIRDPEQADDAWSALADLLPIDPKTLPSVISGSGGASRHLYFISDQPFRSKRLWVSAGKHRTADGRWSFDAEVELFGTGKQVALPPSIHPDTGKPYQWERPLDLTGADLGLPIAPFISAERLSELTEAVTTTFAYETVEPLTFKPGQLESELHEIPISDLHYDDWIRVGQALHHQFGGSQVGFDLWLEHTRRSTKFTGERQVREMRRIKWPSFGRYRGRPVTMGTIRQWVLDARRERTLSQFDDVDAFDEPPAPPPSPAAEITDDDLLGGPAAPVDDIDALGTPGNETRTLDWTSLLDLNEEGAIKPTLHNVKLIVTNDPRSQGVPQFNLFTQEVVQRKQIGRRSDHRKNAAKPAMQLLPAIWEVDDRMNGTLWSDHRDHDLRRVLEAPKTQGGYGIKISDRDLHAAVAVEANSNSFHPIREYLESLEWDGVVRCETLFVDYLGAENNAYTRSIAELMLIAAVCRIYEPGHKFDYSVIIEGLQGKGKSTFIQVLGCSWFGELDGDFHDSKTMIELMQGKWIMEIPELSGFNRGDVRTIKAFISRQEDRARLAYARRAGNFPRQCIFIGSTNDREYLKDDTGGRRWWPVLCSIENIDTAGFADEVDMVWAEALYLYRQMRERQPHGTLPLTLTDPEARRLALIAQEARRVESADDGTLGMVMDWLDSPIQSGGFDEEHEGQIRNETCLIEIWVDCMKGDRRLYNQQSAQMLGRIMSRIDGWVMSADRPYLKNFGRQRIYRRVDHGTPPEDDLLG